MSRRRYRLVIQQPAAIVQVHYYGSRANANKAYVAARKALKPGGEIWLIDTETTDGILRNDKKV